MPHSRSLLACAAAALVGAQSWAQTPADPTLVAVVVSASRSEQRPEETPASVDVIGAAELERMQATDIRTVAHDLPNVSVRHAPARFALTGAANNTGREASAGFNIRGLSGNRVLMMVDGIRLPHSYVYAGNAFGRDYLSLDMLKRVEIVRGPASALYGSDGLGGLVNFVTLDPDDLLRDKQGAARSLGGRVALGWNGSDRGVNAAAAVAGRLQPELGWILNINTRRSHELKTMGTVDAPDITRTTANPQDNRDLAVSGKLVWQPNTRQRHVLTLEHLEKSAAVNLLSSRAKRPLTGTASQIASAVLDERSDDKRSRNRVSWDARLALDSPWADEIRPMLAWQQAAARQYGWSDLNTAADRVRDTTYDESTLQAGVLAQRSRRLSADWMHKLTWGWDWQRSNIRTLTTGVTPLAPETFPLKRFPDTRESTQALYGQSEWLGERWQGTLGLRADRFALDVRSNDYFYPPAKLPPRSLAGSAWSPKASLGYAFTPASLGYVQLAAGFRAPNANQINGYYENTAEQVVVVPNADLQPEKSRGVELGLKHRGAGTHVDVALFTGLYHNLIVDNVLIGGTGTAGNPKRFQTLNMDRARISGVEVKGLHQWGRVGAGRLSTPFAMGIMRGVNRNSGAPINTIDPAHLLLGTRYEMQSVAVRLDMRWRAAKNAEQIDHALAVKAPATQMTVPSSTTFDLSGTWRLRPDLRLQAAIINLTNRKTWEWSDVLGLAASSTVADAYTQPGRHVRVSLVANF